MKFCGAITVAADCTKVHACLTYSTDFGSHILGSVLPLNECEVDETEDIDEVIGCIKKKKAIMAQTRAIIAKVTLHLSVCFLTLNNFHQIPLPEIPPLVLALILTDRKDKAEGIHEQHMKLLKMAAHLDIKVLVMSTDGIAPELLAQEMMDHEKSDHPPLVYKYLLYGIFLKALVFETGLLLSQSDPPHRSKTTR
jgi:hypothetical protein